MNRDTQKEAMQQSITEVEIQIGQPIHHRKALPYMIII